jgi:cytochrome c556
MYDVATFCPFKPQREPAMKRTATKLAAKIAIAITLACSGGAAIAAEKDPAVKARQSLMQLYAHYLGQLGAMAKGQVEYDAEKASNAANSLSTLMGVSQQAMWTPGTDREAMPDQTAALKVLWTTFPAILDKSKAAADATANMAAVAGDGLDAVRGAIGTVGKSCGGCHELYRAK